MLDVLGFEPVLERRAALRAGEEELVVDRAYTHRHRRRAALEIDNLGLEIGLEQPVEHVLSAQLGAPWLG